jgi:hypothetical protein
MKKEKTLEQVILEDWGGGRTTLFQMMNDDHFIGYVTGLTLLQYSSKRNLSHPAVFETAKRLMKEGKL